MTIIPAATLALAVSGLRIAGPTLGDAVKAVAGPEVAGVPRPVLLVFLRHFG